MVASVEADAGGGGFVRAGLGLDDDALRQLGDPVTELRLDDLRQTGWTVAGPAREKDGLTWVRVAHRFKTPDEGNGIAAQLSGPDGPLRELKLRRTRTFLKTKTTLAGLVDLSKGLAGFSDPGLGEALGGADLGSLTDENLHVRVDARLHGETRSWSPKLGQQVRISAEAEAWNVEPILAAVAAAVFAVTGLVILVASRR